MPSNNLPLPASKLKSMTKGTSLIRYRTLLRLTKLLKPMTFKTNLGRVISVKETLRPSVLQLPKTINPLPDVEAALIVRVEEAEETMVEAEKLLSIIMMKAREGAAEEVTEVAVICSEAIEEPSEAVEQ